MPRFWLSLGSNIGDRAANLSEALDRLDSRGLTADAVSSLYETEPVGALAGPAWYLNIAAGGETSLDPDRILEICHAVEGDMGRRRSVPGGPREIDIDLLLLGDSVWEGPSCRIPHPRMHERRFVLAPLAEIAGDTSHPGLRLTIRELLERVSDTARVTRLEGPPRRSGAGGGRAAGNAIEGARAAERG